MTVPLPANRGLDLESLRTSLRRITDSQLDTNATVELDVTDDGITLRIGSGGRVAEFHWEARIHQHSSPQIAIEGRALILCAELDRVRTAKFAAPAAAVRSDPAHQHAVARVVPNRVADPARTPKHEPARRAEPDPSIQPSRHDISRVEASVRGILTDAISANALVRFVIRGDPAAGIAVRVLDGIPRGFKPTQDGRLRIVIEVVGGESEQLILLDRIAMVSRAPQ